MTCREAVIGLVDPSFSDITSPTTHYRILTPAKPCDIIYDCTHDNPAPLAKFQTARIALPMAGVASMADTAIATTWGVDLLIPE